MRLLAALDWDVVGVKFLASWQVPEALFAALWLVRAARRRGNERSSSTQG